MKTHADIQYAHDLCIGIVLGETSGKFDKQVLERLHIAADVLCWVLEHEHNQTFQKNMDNLLEYLRSVGCEFNVQARPE